MYRFGCGLGLGQERVEAANLWRWSNLEGYASPATSTELVQMNAST
jgi:hypothetical protein